MTRSFSLKYAAAAVFTAAGLVLSGCTAASPILTKNSYSASDGIRAQLSDQLRVENLMVLTNGPDPFANVHGALINETTEPVEFKLKIEQLPELRVQVGAKSVVDLPHKVAVPPKAKLQPGAMASGTVTTQGTGSFQLTVPVLDGTIPPYDEYLMGTPDPQPAK